MKNNSTSEQLENAVVVNYTNYRGETADRVIVPEPNGIYLGSTEQHEKKQWLLKCFDLQKQAERTYAMCDIHKWEEDLARVLEVLDA